MDFLTPTFEFDQFDDLFPLSPLHELTIQHDLLLPSLENETIVSKPDRDLLLPSILPSLENEETVSKPGRKRKDKKSIVEIDESKHHGDCKNKKAIHREVERLRRQEMAALNRSLKSLLPPERLKGKRSLSDQMLETVRYIRHMQKSIEELTKKRDFLKKSSNKLAIYVGSKCLPSNFDRTEPADETSSEDIQIVLSTNRNSEMAISRLLHLLIQEGLNVISYTSTNLNERLVHAFESKVCEGRSIKPYELQKKLRCLVA